MYYRDRVTHVKVTINMCPALYSLQSTLVLLYVLHSCLKLKLLFTLPPGEVHCPAALPTPHLPSTL